MKKYKDLVNIQSDTLTEDLKMAQSNYLKSKLEHAVKGLANPTELRFLRKEIAMMKTEIRKRELAQLSNDQLANRSKLRNRRSNK